jgi:serine phosphatase RsbU (regulator of sigma subunit)
LIRALGRGRALLAGWGDVTIEHEGSHSSDAARQALREIIGALLASVVLLAIVLGAVLVARRGVVEAIGATALAVAASLAALFVRRSRVIAQARSHELASERAGREQLDRMLAATRGFHETGSLLELRRQICAVAVEVFACAASLWEVEGEHLRLLERLPSGPPHRAVLRRPMSELPGLRDALAARRPLYVTDPSEASSGATRAAAEASGAGSLLVVPIAVGGGIPLVLGLLWERVMPEPSVAAPVAARFADQAGLALEQARYRRAQAEIASLNRTLRAMVQSDPLFRAGGTVAEVSTAICEKALGAFEATGAALWREREEAIELVERRPAASVLPPQIRIPFAEHAGFAADLQSGQPHFVADVEFEDPVLWERFARYSKSRSQLRVPLASAGGARWLIVLSWREPASPPSAEVSALVSRFADQAAVALAEAERRAADRELAELHARFEHSLLPSIALGGDSATAATFYRPGDDRLTLGGDFYDCIELADGSVALLIGDVAGHGPAAAALGAGLRSAWRALVLGGWRLEELLRGLQAVCVRERSDPFAFVTAIVAVVRPDRSMVRFASAGHPVPLTLGAGATDMAANGPPLGIADDSDWPVSEVALGPAASILLYTDGLVEGRADPGSADRLGVEPIGVFLGGIAAGQVTAADLERLVGLATRANGAGLSDDVALLALNVHRGGGRQSRSSSNRRTSAT